MKGKEASVRDKRIGEDVRLSRGLYGRGMGQKKRPFEQGTG